MQSMLDLWRLACEGRRIMANTDSEPAWVTKGLKDLGFHETGINRGTKKVHRAGPLWTARRSLARHLGQRETRAARDAGDTQPRTTVISQQRTS
jgi:hypothetical protein